MAPGSGSDRHSKNKYKLFKQAGFLTGRPLVFIAAFGLLGAWFTWRSFAATPKASVEVEAAAVSGAASIGSDSTASGGQYLQFGAGSSTGGTSNVTLPARAAFYYPWFPETWSVNGVHVKYSPLLGYYDSSSQTAVDSHIKALDYDGVKVAIASWWGPSTHSETTRIPLLLSRTKALNSNLKWAFYYEKEGNSDPTVAELQSDLNYIKSKYAADSSYAYVNGKPVLFVYNASTNDQTCAIADKWAQANSGIGFYIDQKVFSGYKTCTTQPDSWHQYSPAVATDSQAGYSYAVAPGFWRADEATPRLARDPTRWQSNISSMVASKAPWQLITTFNEWGEGTAVEGAQDWNSASGYGIYQDMLHNTQ